MVRPTIIYKAGDPPPWLKTERELVEAGLLPWPRQGTPALPTGPTASRFEEMPDIPRPEADIGRSR